MTPAARELETALIAADPVDSLRSVVGQRLDRGGLTRESVLGDLEDLREALDEEERSNEEEVVMTVMDHMVGWCNPTLSLVNRGVSEFDDDFVGLDEIAARPTSTSAEELDETWDALDNLQVAGVDEDGLPLYFVGGNIVALAEAQAYLVEQGLADPEILDEA